jgi:hypothetical protein
MKSDNSRKAPRKALAAKKALVVKKSPRKALVGKNKAISRKKSSIDAEAVGVVEQPVASQSSFIRMVPIEVIVID